MSWATLLDERTVSAMVDVVRPMATPATTATGGRGMNVAGLWRASYEDVVDLAAATESSRAD